ncbi:ABC transporter permease [Haloarcula sp. S1CR25-12]|uniref:ABC transporter permease n=1 Tax=Haloarcula saliterrae TaxID=2950534 RepID=A0ABU2FH01_9EURY|nr:ABC transporter permease [Haloarcula sp. S1CR25-12]MDS0261076.1 ABC transporter permease [Haloarcula sp. S1CR25-12]
MSDTIERDSFPGRSVSGAKEWLKSHTRDIVLGYPLVMLLVFFVVPALYLLAVSFFPQPTGEYYSIGFTLEHYLRFFSSSLYLGYLGQTLEFAGLTAVIATALGYPIAYWIARTDSAVLRNLYLLTIIGSMWLTVIIRAYAVQIVFSGNGLFNQFLMGLNVIGEPVTSGTGYFTVMLGMVYGFLPFAVLTMYTSVQNINPELEEASRNLGATKLQTVRRVTLPLSRNGIAASAALVFILSIGSYTVPLLLGNPSEWTLPVIITDVIQTQLNIPFGSALATLMTGLVIVLFAIMVKYLGLGSEQLVGDTYEEEADG